MTDRIIEILKDLNWPVMYETGGGHEFVSANMFYYTGYYAEEIMHNRDFFPARIHQEEAVEINHGVVEWHKNDEPGVLHQTFRFKNFQNQYIWVDDYMVEIKEEQKKYMRGLFIITNEENQEEIELLEKRYQLKKSEKENFSLIANINEQLEKINAARESRLKLAEELFSLTEAAGFMFQEIYKKYAPLQ